MTARLAAVAAVLVSMSVAATARAGTVTVSTETGAGSLRWDPGTPEDLYAYEKLGAGWAPRPWLTTTALAMVLRERLSGTALPTATTWLFGGGAEVRPTESLGLSVFSAGVPTGAGPDGASRWLAAGGLSASYDGIVTGPFVAGVEVTGAFARLGFGAPSGAATIDQWSFGGTFTEVVDERTAVSLALTGYVYDGDTSLFANASAGLGAARSAGIAPYRFLVRPEALHTFRTFTARLHAEVADLVNDTGVEARAGAGIDYETGTLLTPTAGVEAGIRVTSAGVVPSGVVWFGARLQLGTSQAGQ